MTEEIKRKTAELCKLISEIRNVDEQIDVLNDVRRELHAVSPLKDHPADFVEWAPAADVEANDYNPNQVAPPEEKLLRKSIKKFGYTMAIVTCQEHKVKRIVDGFHRRLMLQKYPEIRESTFGRVPVTQIRAGQEALPDRVSGTVLHNRARGVHTVDGMKDIIKKLKLEYDMSDDWIIKNLGLEVDELMRLTQITGIAQLVAFKEFSRSWTPGSDDSLKESVY